MITEDEEDKGGEKESGMTVLETEERDGVVGRTWTAPGGSRLGLPGAVFSFINSSGNEDGTLTPSNAL